MNAYRRFPAALLTVLLAFPAAKAFAEGELHGRVSFEAGGAMIQGQGDADWSYATVNTLILPGDVLWADESATLEIEFSGGSFVRLADSSRAEVAEVPPNGILKVSTGAFYVHRVNRSSGAYRIQTPSCDIQIEPDSHVRVDVVDNGSTTVSVRWGRALVQSGNNSPVSVTRGKRVYCDVGYLPSAPVAFDLSALDAFDEWSRQRAEFIAQGDVEPPAKTRMETTPVGYYELASQGEWMVIEGRQAWRPTVVTNYSPYRSGYWSYVPAYGYCWVDHYSFSYVTSHYGRWDYHPHHGWCWYYRDGWGPAWVAAANYGGSYVWSPLNYYNAPVVCGTSYFDVGGLRFSISACSYAPVNSYYYGPSYCNPLTPAIVNNIHADEVNIWNIYAPGYWRNYGTRSAYGRPVTLGSGSLLRDYSPRRVIRGFDSVTANSPTARSRAVRLENNVNLAALDSARSTNVRSVRTAFSDASRSARVRTPQLDAESTRSVRVGSGRASMGSVSSIALNRSRMEGTEQPATSGRSLGAIRDRGTRDASVSGGDGDSVRSRLRSATADVPGLPTNDRTSSRSTTPTASTTRTGDDDSPVRSYRNGNWPSRTTTAPRSETLSTRPQMHTPSGRGASQATPTERTATPRSITRINTSDSSSSVRTPGRTIAPSGDNDGASRRVLNSSPRTETPRATINTPTPRQVTPPQRTVAPSRTNDNDSSPSRSITRTPVTTDRSPRSISSAPSTSNPVSRSQSAPSTRSFDRTPSPRSAPSSSSSGLSRPSRSQFSAPSTRSISPPSSSSRSGAPSTRSYSPPSSSSVRQAPSISSPRKAPSISTPRQAPSISTPRQAPSISAPRSAPSRSPSFSAPSRSSGPSRSAAPSRSVGRSGRGR